MLSALVMIGLVLIQHGKGADMGASFGSGASGSLFGATGSANFLSRSTAVCAAVFFACTLALAFSSNKRRAARRGAAAACSTAPRPAAQRAARPAHDPGRQRPAAPLPAACGVPAAIPARDRGAGAAPRRSRRLRQRARRVRGQRPEDARLCS